MNPNPDDNRDVQKPSLWMRTIRSFAFIFFLCPTFLTLLAQYHWTFDLLTSFHVQYAIGLLSLTILFLLKREWLTTTILLAGLLYNLSLILPVYLPPEESPSAKNPIRLLVTNVWSSNNQHEKLVRLIRHESPDLILAIEVNEAWSRAFLEFSEEYPHRKSFTRPDNFGIALLSRHPFQRAEILQLGDRQLPTVFAEILFEDDASMSLIGTHPLPPMGRAAAMRNQQLSEVANFASKQTGNVILCGDLNVTPWSPCWHQLLQESHLKDSRQGFGIQSTWPAANPLLRIPIDHVLISDRIQVQKRRVGPDIGSDHFPVIIDLGLSQN